MLLLATASVDAQQTGGEAPRSITITRRGAQSAPSPRPREGVAASNFSVPSRVRERITVQPRIPSPVR
jgi:hypothetical protein